MRLDKALAQDSHIESRSQATSLIDRGFVTLNGEKVKPAHITKVGECFHVFLIAGSPVELVPYEFKLNIVYEDNDVIVVDKPSGLVVHPCIGHRRDTLVNALLHHTNELASGFSEGRPGIVHRIDKDTSGLLVVAKNDRSLRFLGEQFKNKSLHRVYWAVTYGVFKNSSGTIRSYLKRHPTQRKRFASEKLAPESQPTGKLAVTHYRVIKSHPSNLSLVHCQLETGRTHQIRVHLSEAGHPILSDPFYCTSHRVKSVKSVHLRKIIQETPHLFLHAAELGFVHPTTKEQMLFKRPWPDELIPILTELQFL
jgi:23S rRNA pseudouridine1911/1915/1917 synthase